jgi:hypothetical protein
MGLFGPTKKGGGLDRRFKSNKGGYLGKALGLASSLNSTLSSSSSSQRSSYTPLTQQQKDSYPILRKMFSIQDELNKEDGLFKTKEELIYVLDYLSKYIKVNVLVELSGVSNADELDWDAHWGPVKRQARFAYEEACKKLRNFSFDEAKVFENVLSEILDKEKAEERKKKETKYMKTPYYRFIARVFNISVFDARKYFILGSIIFALIFLLIINIIDA